MPGNEGQKDTGGGFKGSQLPNLYLKQTTEMDYITQNKKVILESILLIKKKTNNFQKGRGREGKGYFYRRY